MFKNYIRVLENKICLKGIMWRFISKCHIYILMKNKKIIVYCIGAIFEKYKDKLLWNQIVAIIDKRAENNELIMDKPVYRPSKIKYLQYDYIVVFSTKYFIEILKELVFVWDIPVEKIVPWRILFDNRLTINYEYLRNICRGLKHNNVLIREADKLDRYILNRESIGISPDSIFDACTIGEKNLPEIKYNNIFNTDEIPINKQYDIVITTDYKNLDSIVKIHNWRKILLIMQYSMDEKKYYTIKNYIKELSYRVYIGINGWIWEIENNVNKLQHNENANISIYVVTHKDYPEIKDDDCYQPICVSGKYNNHRYVSELYGNNIAYLNDKINECTALYWIWKNTKEKIVGLNHYRRYFYRGIINDRADILSSYEICQIMNEYDMILPLDEGFNITVEEQLINTIPDKEIAKCGINLIREGIIDKQPDYLTAFNEVMSSYNFYRCNMFITSREILNQYCEWLFSFLIDAAEQIDVSETDEYSKRTIGFLAERMLTVWLRKNPQRIKVVPYLLL